MRPVSYHQRPQMQQQPGYQQAFYQQPALRPPVFIQAPQSHYCAEGDTVRFDALISSASRAKATWMHNNKSLMASSRYRTYFDGQNACLIITGISDYDQGIYTLIVENRDGFDSRSAELRITAPRVIKPHAFAPQHQYVSYASPARASQAAERHPDEGGIDTTSYIPADELARLEGQRIRSAKPVEGPTIDDRPIVNLQGIRELELRRQQRQQRLSDTESSDKQIIAPPLRHIGESTADVIQKQLRKYNADQSSTARPIVQAALSVQSAVDSRPIVDPSAFSYLERAKPTLSQSRDEPVVDTRPIVDPAAFRYLEKPAKTEELKGPRAVVDSSSIVDPSAFMYIERPSYPQHTELKESVIDTRPIVDPRAFRCLELPLSRPSDESAEPEIDTRPIVDPAAFKYIEPPARRQSIVRRPFAEGSIDTSSLIDQNAFKHLERAEEVKAKDTRAEIDSTPMVPPDAFKYIEPRPRAVRRRPDSPTIDTTTYVDNRPLIMLEHTDQPKPDIQPGIDDSSYIPESALRALEHQPTVRQVSNEPVIDSRPIISPEAFSALDRQKKEVIKDSLPEIDDRSYVNPTTIANLERKPEKKVIESEDTGIAPNFLNKLNDVRAREGDTITMSAIVAAAPLPEINWYKNNRPLDKSSRIFYFINMRTKMAVLTIKSVNAEDAGVYTLVAHNKFGEADTSASLAITEQPSIDDTNFVPLQQIRDLELKGETGDRSKQEADDVVLLAKPSKGKTADANAIAVEARKEKPSFETLMQDQTATEGATVRMLAKVYGLPTPELTLLRDSDILLESSRLKFDYDFNNSTAIITIKGVTKLDDGVYTILAKNEKGLASNFARLTVVPSDEDAAPKVPVKVALQSSKFSAVEGDDFKAVFSVTGVPTPTVSVMFNGQAIDASSRMIVAHNFFEKRAVLVIKSVQLSDAGKYELRAEQLGHVETAAFNLTVDRADSILTTSRLPEHALDHLQKAKEEKVIEPGVDKTSYAHDPEKLQALERPHPTEEAHVDSEGEAPSFEGILRPVKAIETRQAVLKVKFKGKPFPEALWLKDGLPVELSSRVSSIVDMAEKFAALLIKSLRFSDSGVYEIRLSNAAGQVSQSATLTVLPDKKDPIDHTSYIDWSLIETLEEREPEVDNVVPGVDSNAFVDPQKFKYLSEGNIYKLDFKEDTSAYRMPQIVQPLPSTLSVKELDCILLHCLVESYPLPLIRWLKDGEDLVGSSRFKMDYNMSTKFCSLAISDARPSDSGAYKVIVKNPVGEKYCECRVQVTGDKSIDTQAFISPEAFTGIEKNDPPRHEEVTPGVDSSTYFDQSLFKSLEEGPRQSAPVELEAKDEALVIHSKQRDCTVNEGDNIFLFVNIRGHPICQVQWYHNGQLLSASARISMDIYMASKTCWLQVKSCIAADKGIYNVFASNKMGSVSAQFYVDVIESCNIERTGYVSQQAFDKLEHRSQATVPVEPGVDTRSIVDFEKFAAFERGIAAATDTIPEIDRRSFVDAEKFIELERKPTREASDDMADETGVAPTIKAPLKDQQAQEGTSECLLSALVEGRPPPEIIWLKDGTPLAASSRIKSDYDLKSKVASLRIAVVNKTDQGLYSLLAKNAFGAIESSCLLSVGSAQGIDDRSLSRRRPTSTSSVGLEFLDQVSPVNYVTEEDEDFTAEFVISSDAAFKLSLWKDHRPVVLSNRLDCFYNVANNSVTVKLRHVTTQDAGSYVCVAENQTSKAEKHFTLKVKAKLDKSRDWIVPNKEAIEALMREPQTQALDEVNEVDTTSYIKDRSVIDALERKPIREEPKVETVQPLHIEVPLSDLVVGEMSTAVLHVRLGRGSTVDTAHWALNGHPLVCSNRFHMKLMPNEVSLEIQHCTSDDTGLYQLTLGNSAGTVETSAKLTVVAADHTDKQRDISQYQLLEEASSAPKPVDKEEKQRPQLRARSLMADKTHCSEGQLIELKISLKNGPAEQVKWYRDGTELAQSSRYTTIYNHELLLLALRIESLEVIDQGKYSVQLLQQHQAPVLLFLTQLFVSRSSGIDSSGNILSLEQLMALEPKIPKDVDNLPAGVDSTNYVGMQNFQRLEQPLSRPQIIEPGIDTTSYIPLSAFDKLEQETPRIVQEYSPPVNYDLQLLEQLESDPSTRKMNVVECHDTLEQSCTIGRLSDVDVGEYENFTLACSFTSSSLDCQVHWLFNGHPLEVSPRHSIECDQSTKTISLHVSSARFSDSGIYTAVIGKTGQKFGASTSARVVVRPSKGVDTEPIVESTYKTIASEQAEQEQNFPKQTRPAAPLASRREQQANVDRIQSAKQSQGAVPTGASRKKVDPPTIEQLKCDNPNVKEGDSTRFQAIVHGASKVTWQLNGRLASGSSRFMQTSKGDHYELAISAVRQFDQGELKLTARNSGGQTQMTCALTVQLDAEHDPQEERLLQFCLQKNAASNEFTKLKEEYTKRLQQTGENSKLTDEVAQNFLETTWQRIVQGKEQPGNSNADKTVSEAGAGLQFVSKIRSVSVLEGGSALFIFVLNCNTGATVRWMRGKSPIAPSKFVKLIFDGKSGALLLNKVCADEEGDYCCIVDDGKAKIQCAARLHVHKSSALM